MVYRVLHKWISRYLYDDDVNEMLPDFTAFVGGPLADSARVAKLGALLSRDGEEQRASSPPRRQRRRWRRAGKAARVCLRPPAAASPLRRGAVLAV